MAYEAAVHRRRQPFEGVDQGSAIERTLVPEAYEAEIIAVIPDHLQQRPHGVSPLVAHHEGGVVHDTQASGCGPQRQVDVFSVRAQGLVETAELDTVALRHTQHRP